MINKNPLNLLSKLLLLILLLSTSNVLAQDSDNGLAKITFSRLANIKTHEDSVPVKCVVFVDYNEQQVQMIVEDSKESLNLNMTVADSMFKNDVLYLMGYSISQNPIKVVLAIDTIADYMLVTFENDTETYILSNL